jgi:hypothetical protein
MLSSCSADKTEPLERAVYGFPVRLADYVVKALLFC